MLVWRLCKARRAASVPSGKGSQLAGARWTPVGLPMVYCSSSVSLATLELLVHLDMGELPSEPYVAIELQVPDAHVEAVADGDLPPDWREEPTALSDPQGPKDFGETWYRSKRSLALSLPSAVIQHERNLILNPDHHAIEQVTVTRTLAYRFDPRLFLDP